MRSLLFCLFISFLLVTRPSDASEFIEGKHYVVVAKERTHKPEIIEFFSFYCAHCYAFETTLKLCESLRRLLPPDGGFKKCQVEFMGGKSRLLTQAWTTAIALGIEDKMKVLLFEGTLGLRAINTPKAIKKIFLSCGITEEQYDGTVNSFIVTALAAEQRTITERLKINAIPSVVINGKYRIETANIEGKTAEEFLTRYLKLAKMLLDKET